jgi:hypothetical protein
LSPSPTIVYSPSIQTKPAFFSSSSRASPPIRLLLDCRLNCRGWASSHRFSPAQPLVVTIFVDEIQRANSLAGVRSDHRKKRVNGSVTRLPSKVASQPSPGVSCQIAIATSVPTIRFSFASVVDRWAADVVERHTGRLAPMSLDTIKGSPSMHNP